MEYVSFEKENWQGRIDEEDGVLGLRIHQIISSFNHQSKTKVLLGFCTEEGVKRNKGRLGASEAPNIIRKALGNLPVHFTDHTICDAGNIIVNDQLEVARKLQIEKVSEILEKNNLPIVIGGGHETALGNFLAFVSKYPNNSLVINLDAHFDIRLPNPISTSGTPFYEMYLYCKAKNIPFNYTVFGIQTLGNTQALFQRANQLNINYVLADEIHDDFNLFINFLHQLVNQHKNIYLTIDMDVFDVAYAPGVSATTINGLTPYQVKKILQILKESGKVKLVDLVEVNPNYDRDSQTAKLASHLIYEYLKD